MCDAVSVRCRPVDALQKLLDLQDIKNLRHRYGDYLDSNNLTELGQLFSAHAVCDAGHGDWRGRAAIVVGLQPAFVDYNLEQRGSYPFLHAVTNQWSEFVDADTAQGRCYLLDLQTLTKAEREPWILLGMYADEYRRIDGRWFITRSRLDVVWPTRNVRGGDPGRGLVLPAPTAAQAEGARGNA